MAVEVAVDEPVQVLVRILPDGEMAPTSFVWRDKTRYVADVGRRWEERVEGKRLRCFLVKAVDDTVYELCWDPSEDEWRLHRAWLQNVV